MLFSMLRLTVAKILQLDARGMLSCTKILLNDKIVKLNFIVNAIRHPMHPTRGITLIGHFGAKDSLGKVARDLAIGLRNAGIPFQTYSLDRNTLEGFSSIETPRNEFRTLKYNHVLDIYGSPFPTFSGISRGSILFWEFESGFPEAHPLHMNLNAVAMSDFDQTYFQKIFKRQGTVPKILYPFRLNVGDLPSRDDIRKRFNIGKDAVAVFFNFDFGSSIGRKNPDGLMRAFAKAANGNANARLVFKTMRATPEAVEALLRQAESLGIANQFIHISQYLSTTDLYGLTAACDIYASLHRGEGFGLGIAEAMSLGVPVLVTAYSAPMEFCNNENSALVSYTMVEPMKDQIKHICYKDIAAWAEPDIDAAAAKLRLLLSDAGYRDRLGDAAKRFISEHFSVDNFRRSINNYLDR